MKIAPSLLARTSGDLLHPLFIRMPGNVRHGDPAASKREEEQHVICRQPPPGEHFHCEEVRIGHDIHVSGDNVADICRKLGVSDATFYTWKKQYTGLGVQEPRELRELREENGRLKRIVADLSLDQQILQEIVSKKL
jgi:putative transposase